MARRAEIVRALINDPKVLLLDEPYRAMDALTKSIMHEALLEMYDRTKVTIFFITHDLDESIFLGDKVVVMTTRPARTKKSRRGGHTASSRLHGSFFRALPQARGRDQGRRARGGAQSLRGR